MGARGGGEPLRRETGWRAGKGQEVTALVWQGRPRCERADLKRRGNPGGTCGAHVGGDVETPGPAPFRRATPRLSPHSLHEFLRSEISPRGRYPGGLTAADASAPATTAS